MISGLGGTLRLSVRGLGVAGVAGVAGAEEDSGAAAGEAALVFCPVFFAFARDTAGPDFFEGADFEGAALEEEGAALAALAALEEVAVLVEETDNGFWAGVGALGFLESGTVGDDLEAGLGTELEAEARGLGAGLDFAPLF